MNLIFLVKLVFHRQIWLLEGFQKNCVPILPILHHHAPALLASPHSWITPFNEVANSKQSTVIILYIYILPCHLQHEPRSIGTTRSNPSLQAPIQNSNRNRETVRTKEFAIEDCRLYGFHLNFQPTNGYLHPNMPNRVHFVAPWRLCENLNANISLWSSQKFSHLHSRPPKNKLDRSWIVNDSSSAVSRQYLPAKLD